MPTGWVVDRPLNLSIWQLTVKSLPLQCSRQRSVVVWTSETLAQAVHLHLLQLLSLILYVPLPYWKCCSAHVGLDRSGDTIHVHSSNISAPRGYISKGTELLEEKRMILPQILEDWNNDSLTGDLEAFYGICFAVDTSVITGPVSSKGGLAEGATPSWWCLVNKIRRFS